MLDFIVRNRSLLILFVVMFIAGQLGSMPFYFIGGLVLVILWRKQLYPEILLGFLFILVLSDSLRSETDFAKDFKNVYMLFIAGIGVIERNRFGAVNRIYTYFLPFFAVALVSMFFSPQIPLAFQKTLSYFLLILSVPQLFRYAYRQRGPVFLKDLLYLSTVLILIGFVLDFFSPGLAYSHGGRFRGIFGNPNGIGIFSILILGLIYLVRDIFPNLLSKSDLRWMTLPILLVILMSGSRTAIIAALLFFFFTRFYTISPFIGFVVFLATAFAVELISSNLTQIVESLGIAHFFRADTLAEGSGRYIAWEFAWVNIQEHFWLGKGFAFDEWLMRKNQDMLNQLGHQGGVHNTYLIIWLNTGIIGLILFLRAILLLFIRGAKNTPLSFPYLWMVLFSILLEPWLAASLNPFSILFFLSVTLITDEVFQTQNNELTLENETAQTIPA